MGKRLFDLVFVIPGILILGPLMLLLAIVVKLDSPGPVLFKQTRVGRFGVPFELYKFRSMTADIDSEGPSITAAGDTRITRAGRFLRKSKLDELPQLFNVLSGKMSLVGPRPEVQMFVDVYTEGQRETILSVKPGITDNASIEYRNESELLAASDNAESFYVDNILPKKIGMYEQYVANNSIAGDSRILLATFRAIFTRH